MNGEEKLKPACKECPYRKNSLPGYLGEASFQPEEFLQQLDFPDLHPCHLSVNWEDPGSDEKGHVCTGALQFMNNSCKQSRNPKVLALQREAGKSDEILSFNKQFIEHHS